MAVNREQPDSPNNLDVTTETQQMFSCGQRFEVSVPELLDDERLDRVICTLSAVSRSQAAQMVTSGEVTIDGAAITQRSYRVCAGQLLTFVVAHLAPDAVVEPDSTIEFGVLYEDDDIIVIDKPSGLVVHPGAGRPDKTLVNGLVARYSNIAQVGDTRRPGIVHRLDQQTSGALIVARTQKAYEVLVDDLAQRRIGRHYLAIVDGTVIDPKGIIDAPIGRSPNRRTRMAISAEGKPARTHYFVLDRSEGDRGATALRATLETGRTHQIRVHLCAIGHPVLGDHLYAGALCAKRFSRVALHAHRLEFTHPVSGEKMTLTADIPDDMKLLSQELSLDFVDGGYEIH